VKEYPVHPAAAFFPLMDEGDYLEFKADLERRGQQEPIRLLAGKILDGRTRSRACSELGREVLYETLPKDTDPWAYVVSTNLHRRHLTADQRAALAVDLEEKIAPEAKERQKTQAGRGKEGGRGKKKTLPANLREGFSRDRKENESSEKAARLLKVKARKVQAQKAIKKADPVLHEKVKNREITHAQARTEVKRREKRAALLEKAALAADNGQSVTWEIRQGDCLAELAKVEAGSVRLAFADPPYDTPG